MATLEKIDIAPVRFEYGQNGIDWVITSNKVTTVPHIFYSDGSPWLEANKYAIDKLNSTTGNNPKTVESNHRHLKAYADWLELTKTDWMHFPNRKSERCLFRYRGYLVEQRNKRIIAPSTASARMSAAIRFYRWVKQNNLIAVNEMWADRIKSFRYFDSVGFERTVQVASSELTIPNIKTSSEYMLEDGLLPISDLNKKKLLDFLFSNEMTELYLIFKIAFFTGARSETIRTLRIENIENSIFDPLSNKIKRIAVGPGTKVLTKYGVRGSLIIPSQLVEELENYAYSVRRLVRANRASKDKRSILFLTQRGNSYSETSFTKLISNLRKQLIQSGHSEFMSLKFHQSRATFGTTLMKIALNEFPDKTDAIRFVRDCMLHKKESITWKYVKFVETTPIKKALSDEFFNIFVGKHSQSKKLINEVTYSEQS